VNLHDAKPLVAAAIDARNRAYAPYSRFQVGAAVLTSYGLTMCAERAAVAAAVAAGQQELVAVAVVSKGGHAPCGACRQVLTEFGSTMQVVLVDADDQSRMRTTKLDQLLPEGFGPSSLVT
jgi:cytidine deaminase